MSKIEWIPVVIRPATDEEKEVYGDSCETILVFELPEYEEEVLVTLENGVVTTDYYYDDWKELDKYNWNEVRAWAEMPKGYGE